MLAGRCGSMRVEDLGPSSLAGPVLPVSHLGMWELKRGVLGIGVLAIKCEHLIIIVLEKN